MLTLAQFKARFPEFAEADDTMLQAVLDEQEENLADDWGDREEEVHGLKTADALATSAHGRRGRLIVSKEMLTQYRQQIDRLQNVHACGRRRVVV